MLGSWSVRVRVRVIVGGRIRFKVIVGVRIRVRVRVRIRVRVRVREWGHQSLWALDMMASSRLSTYSPAHLQFTPASSELGHLEHLLGHLLCHGDEGVALLQELVSQFLQ